MPASSVQTPPHRSPSRLALRAEGAPMGTCHYTSGPCEAAALGQALGTNILETFLRFAASARLGDSLSLQRNRDGVTIQVTRSVRKQPDGNGHGAGAA